MVVRSSPAKDLSIKKISGEKHSKEILGIPYVNHFLVT